MPQNKNKPQFGPLNDVKVLHCSANIAGAIGPEFMADFGADVTWIESAKGMDLYRVTADGWGTEQERRNQRAISCDVSSKEGKRILLALLKDTDIFVESSKGGQYAKWGLTDELLWSANPALVIVHISGFGQYGDERYWRRGAYDTVAQAFSGYMMRNGFPDRSPVPALPVSLDYMTGLYATCAALAALNHARLTGEGDSIDITQFEVGVHCQTGMTLASLNTGVTFPREGNKGPYAGTGIYRCKDGYEVYASLGGAGVVKKAVGFLDLEYGTEDFPVGTTILFRGTKGGDLFDQKLEEYFLSRTSVEADEELGVLGYPASVIMDIPDLVDHPHYTAREVFVEWEDMDGRMIKGLSVHPKLKNNPGRTWRPCPYIGQDNEELLLELGYSPTEIDELYKENVLIKKDFRNNTSRQ